MSEAVVDDIVAVLPPLLQSLDALSFIARHLNPPDFGRIMEAAGTPIACITRPKSGGLRCRATTPSASSDCSSGGSTATMSSTTTSFIAGFSVLRNA